MKLYISSDMEGTAGIVSWPETEKKEAEYSHWAESMSREVAAVCEGAYSEGVTDILVKDAHDSARNLNPDLLPEYVRIFRGWDRSPMSMMAGLDSSYSGAIFTGYHSAAGMPTNPLSHTMTTRVFTVKCNGLLMPEALINAYIASMKGVPVIMVTGDRGICDYMKGYVPSMETVPVSEGAGGGSISLQPRTARLKMKEAAARAIFKAKAGSIPCFPLPPQFEIEITYKDHFAAASVSSYPGIKQISPYCLIYSADRYQDVLTMFHFCL